MDERRAVGALLFLSSGMAALDVFSTTNSSPWTAESFGADERRVAALREYVAHAVILSSGYAVVSAVISGSWWPIIGAVGADAYMVWLYERAIGRARDAGSTSWADGTN